jgi:hypothetical protein
MQENPNSLLSGMQTMEALSLYSETDAQYQITWHCGRGEASQRQRVSGEGDVVEDGYQRTVPHEFFAEIARDDPNATVEEV